MNSCIHYDRIVLKQYGEVGLQLQQSPNLISNFKTQLPPNKQQLNEW